MTPVVVALGSNVGDPASNLRRAVERLRSTVAVDRVSSIYRTAPMYVTDQDDFMNAVLVGRSELGPRGLLRLLKDTEADMGRESRIRYGPREIDLDLIAFGALAYRFLGGDKPLVVPHPKTVERRFVLLPLCEIAPEFKLMGLGVASDLLPATEDQARDVERLDHAPL